jgi:hypothetical protein
VPGGVVQRVPRDRPTRRCPRGRRTSGRGPTLAGGGPGVVDPSVVRRGATRRSAGAVRGLSPPAGRRARPRALTTPCRVAVGGASSGTACRRSRRRRTPRHQHAWTGQPPGPLCGRPGRPARLRDGRRGSLAVAPAGVGHQHRRDRVRPGSSVLLAPTPCPSLDRRDVRPRWHRPVRISTSRSRRPAP